MKVYVYFYNDNNLGDDLFLDCLLKRYPDIKFYIYLCPIQPKLNVTLSLNQNLYFADKLLNHKSMDELSNFYDGVILIGGSNFQDLNYKLYKGYLGRFLIFREFIKKGKDVLVLGANLGPFNTIFGKLIMKNIIKNTTGIVVRDNYSYDLLKSWGINNKFLAPDMVFGYQYQPDVIIKNIIGISVINTQLYPQKRDSYISKLTLFINKYLQKHADCNIRLFAFDGGHENDGVVINEIIKNIDDKSRVLIVNYDCNTNIYEYLDMFAECRFIITTRFHAMVLAVKYDISFYPICYSKKINQVLSDLNYPYNGVDYSDIDTLDIDQLILQIDNGKRLYKVQQEIIDQSVQHFKFLDEAVSHEI